MPQNFKKFNQQFKTKANTFIKKKVFTRIFSLIEAIFRKIIIS